MKDEGSSQRTALGRVTPSLVVVLLLLLHVVLVASNMANTSATNDETLHVVAGHSYLALHDFRLNPEHPPLVKELAALPLRFLDLRPSDLREIERAETASPAIGKTLGALQERWARSLRDPVSQWMFAHEFLYGVTDDVYRRTGALSSYDLPTTESYSQRDFVNDAGKILLAARIPMLAFSLTLALLVFFWARELRGIAGGIVALALFALEPNFIAHAALVTTDVAVCTGIFGACYFVWRSFQRLTLQNAAGAAIFASVAATSKFSSAALFVVLPLLVIYRTFSKREWSSDIRPFKHLDTIGSRAAASAALLAVILVTSWLAIWAVYGFRFTAVPDRDAAAQAEARAIAGDEGERVRLLGNREGGSLPLDRAVREGAVRRSLAADYPDGVPPDVLERKLMSVRLGSVDRLVTWTARNHLLPEGYVYGFATMRSGAKRSAFLRGDYGYGFNGYFVWTTLLKTPVVTLLAIALSFLLLRRYPWRGSLAVIATMAALYFAIATAGRINIGHRHILPVIPFLLLLCSVLGAEWERLRKTRRRAAAAIFTLLVISAPIAVFAPPWRPQVVVGRHLSYFNELSGGPLRGHEQLVDSNLDWGQDLPALAQWLASHQVKEPVNLCYFGTADPRFHGVRFVNLFLGYVYAREVPLADVKRPGLVAISGTNLRGVYYTEEGRAPWRELLRDAELVGRAGYSIFIYRLR